MRQLPQKPEIQQKVSESVRASGLSGADAAKVTREVVREILGAEEPEWEDKVAARIEAAQLRLRDAHLFRQGFTVEQIEGFRLHYSR